MKISLHWLKDYVAISEKAEILAERLTMAGLEVEGVLKKGKDAVFEIEVTPNRADCLSIIGIAREIAAVLNKKLETPKIKLLKKLSKKISVSIEDKQGCLQYVATVVEGVSVGKAPQWLTQRIESVGIRPISNIVDITNFCLMEMGQPLHAFDYDKISGGKIVVRRARQGETITTIDGVERKLDPSILVIADDKKPIAIAGIMGGKDTEVTGQTKNILLESAYFNPVLIRRASRKLGLNSDSSYRFERGVDIAAVGVVSDRALNFILSQAGGQLVRQGRAGSSKAFSAKSIKISIEAVSHFIGVDFTLGRVQKILSDLGFHIKSSGKKFLIITPPSFRKDISSEVDVVEEIARVIGYDKLPMSMPQVKVNAMKQNEENKKRTLIRNSMAAQGFSEALTYSLINEDLLEKTKEDINNKIKVKNPLSKDQELMRPSFLPGLLQVAATNINKGQKNFKIFEIGKIYSADKERPALALLGTGMGFFDWRAESRPVDFFDLKGAVVELMDRQAISGLRFEAKDYPFFEAGASADIYIGKERAGCLGKIDVNVQKLFDIKNQDIIFGQIELAVVYSQPEQRKEYKSLSEYPSVSRDISLAVNKDITYRQICDVVYSLAQGLVRDISLLEEYLGEKIDKNKRGIVFSLTYQAADRTLTESEVNAVHGNIVKALTQELNAVQR